jgi:predicted membrane-bound spermidine synthase
MRFPRRRDRILVVGAGGGCDVQAALMSGARHVDAVEIDRTIIGISKRFSAGAPYHDPRVEVHIDDARSFLAKASPGYDLVVFGFLDSQALFSSMNNVRLDGYVYTVESIRSAYRLLGDHGMLSMSFYLGRQWLGPKLFWLVAEATGRTPAMFVDASGQRPHPLRSKGRTSARRGTPGRCTSRTTGRCRTSTCRRTTGRSST